MAAPVQETPLEELEREIATLGASLARRMARWLDLVAEFDRREAARAAGFRGTAEWLAWRCGIGSRAAREHVRVARRLAEMPRVRSEFADGGLSYSKVRAITRADATEDEGSLLALAETSTADGLERAVRALRSAASGDLEAGRRAHERRSLDWAWEGDGALRLYGHLAPDDGVAFIEAIETAAEALHAAVSEADPGSLLPRPPRGARRADALAEIVQSGCPRTQVVLHVDRPALGCTASATENRLGEVCALEAGPAVPSETARRLACDGAVIPAVGRDDGGLDLGRARRVVSPALRTSLQRRDGGCRFPGCDRRHGLHAHHLTHWAHGGPTDRANLVLLCRYHHRLVHEGGFAVYAEGTAVRFARPDGEVIDDLPPPVGAAA